MVPPTPPLPAWTRVAWPAALLAPLAAGLLRIPSWIPSWQGPVRGFALALALSGVAAALAYALARLRSTPRTLDRRLVVAVLVSNGLLLLSVTVAFLGQLEIFPPHFKFMITAHGTRAYVYDVGFLDQETMVRVRRGSFPTHAPLVRVRGCSPRQVALDPDGYTLRVCRRRCDLRSLHCD